MVKLRQHASARAYVVLSLFGSSLFAAGGCGDDKVDNNTLQPGDDAGSQTQQDAANDTSTHDATAPAPDAPAPDATVPPPVVPERDYGPTATGGWDAEQANPYGGTDYFVSQNGDDANPGTQASPWKTLAKVRTTSMAAGSRIFLQRGGKWREKFEPGKSGTTEKPIVISAYGTGPSPIVSCGEPVTDWSVHAGAIYKAPLESASDQLYWNGVHQTIARYPNKGQPWLKKEVDNTSTGQAGHHYLKDSTLPSTFGGDDWVGASVVTRDSLYSYLPSRVTAWDNTNKRLTLNFAAYNSANSPAGEWRDYPGWGYFFFGKLSFLDEAGEWVHSGGQVYFRAPGDANPSSGLVEIATRETGIDVGIGTKHLILEELTVEQCTKVAVEVPWENEHIRIRRMRVQNSNRSIGSSIANQVTIEQSHIRHIWHIGSEHYLARDLTVQDNLIEDIGMEPGKMPSNWGYYGLNIGTQDDWDGATYVIRRNHVRNIGYIGIGGGGNGVIEENLVENTLLTLNDGGAVAIDWVKHNEQLIIRKNMMLNCIGDVSSVAPTFHHPNPMCHMMYYGDKSPANTRVENNVIAHASASGVHVDHAEIMGPNGTLVPSFGAVVTGNKIFGCGNGISQSDYSLHFTNYTMRSCAPNSNSPCFVANFDDSLTNNDIYSTEPAQYSYQKIQAYSNGTGAVADFGTSNNNRLFHPTNPEGAIHSDRGAHSGNTQTWTLAQWRTNSGQDLQSTSSSGVQDLAPAASRGRLVMNKSFSTQTLSVADGTLERCLYRLDGTPVAESVTLGPLEGFIAERGIGPGC